jgi:hypothetical protein
LQKLIEAHLHDAKVLDSVTNFWGDHTRLAEAAEHREKARLLQLRLTGMVKLRLDREGSDFVQKGTATVGQLGIGTAGAQVAMQGAKVIQFFAGWAEAGEAARVGSQAILELQAEMARRKAVPSIDSGGAKPLAVATPDPVPAWNARNEWITNRLREHMMTAVRKAELTPPQVRDIQRSGRASTHWGTQIDTEFKKLVESDAALSGEVVGWCPETCGDLK